MKMKKIGITGATGLVGKKLLNYYLQGDYKVKVITRDLNKINPNENLEIFEINLEQIDQKMLSLFLEDLDVLFHLAAEIKDEHRIFKINVRAVHEIINQIDIKKTHFIYLSSIGIFDFKKNKVITNKSSLNPLNSYESSKLEAEKIINDTKGLTASILRPSTILSADMKSNLLKHLYKIANNRVTVNFNDYVISNFILLEDVISALILIENNSKKKSGTYNLSRDIKLNSVLTNLKINKTWQLKIHFNILKPLINTFAYFNGNLHFFTNQTQIDISEIKDNLEYQHGTLGYDEFFKIFLENEKK